MFYFSCFFLKTYSLCKRSLLGLEITQLILVHIVDKSQIINERILYASIRTVVVSEGFLNNLLQNSRHYI